MEGFGALGVLEDSFVLEVSGGNSSRLRTSNRLDTSSARIGVGLDVVALFPATVVHGISCGVELCEPSLGFGVKCSATGPHLGIAPSGVCGTGGVRSGQKAEFLFPGTNGASLDINGNGNEMVVSSSAGLAGGPAPSTITESITESYTGLTPLSSRRRCSSLAMDLSF